MSAIIKVTITIQGKEVEFSQDELLKLKEELDTLFSRDFSRWPLPVYVPVYVPATYPIVSGPTWTCCYENLKVEN